MAAAQAAQVQPRPGFEGWSFPVCSVRGVPVRVHAFLPLSMVLSAASAAAVGVGMMGVLCAVLVSGPLLLLTVLVHEFGHVLAARQCGFAPDHILLWPLGGLAYISKDGITPRQQIYVSSMGPATHLPMMALWAVAMLAFNGGRVQLAPSLGWSYTTHFVPIVCLMMLVNNMAMLLFNLLVPCIPLDCSQIFVSLLLMCGCQVDFAAKIMVFVSIPVVCVLIGLSIWGMLGTVASLSSSMNLVLAFWLGVQTWQLHQARMQGLLSAMPLFATAMAQQNAAAAQEGAAGPAQARTFGGSNKFKPFEGTGNVLGRTTNSEVCLGSVVAVALSLAIAAQVAAAQ